MSGKMRKRRSGAARATGLAKSFHASQKDNSKRAKRKAKLNNYNDDKKEDQ